MASYGEPDWANPGDTTTAAPEPQAPIGAQTVDAASEPRNNTKCVLSLLSLVNMVAGVLMATLGVLVILEYEFSGAIAAVTSEPFLAAYMILFGSLLFLYETMWWIGIPVINKTLRKNFGFMYGLRGKGLYMIFIAFLAAGLKDADDTMTKSLAWITGIGFLALGLLHLFVTFVYPDYVDLYQPPTAGLEGSPSAENIV